MSTVLLALFVFLAFLVEATLGFGATVVAVSLGAFVVTIPELLPAFVPLNLVLSGFIVFRYGRDVDWRLLLGRILPLMGLGFPFGMWFFASGEHALLVRAFGAFVLLLAVAEFWRMLRAPNPAGPGASAPDPGAHPRVPAAVQAAALLIAGLVHGAFGTGGPLVVWVAGRELPEKGRFRSTLSALWLLLGLALLGGYVLTGTLTAESARLCAILALPLALGIAAGVVLHDRVDAVTFRRVVYGMLGIAGLLLLVRG